MRRIPLRYIGLAIGLLLAAFLLLPIFGRTAERSPVTRNLSNLRQIGLALRLYAEDHEAQFPDTLEDLVPDYLPDVDVLRYRDPFSDYSYDWRYYSGHGTRGSIETIVAASPSQHLSPKQQNARLVLHPRGDVHIVPDAAYRARIKEQQSKPNK